ncbi:MAG: Verru Chthon cassette protein [Verrucomicrobiaceae bacterium]|nr:Verru Chthon cassette protein [Verrucomicrobiaceae bacterium]
MRLSLQSLPVRGRARHGFTLVEIIVATAVLSLLMVAMMSTLGTVQRSFQFTRARVDQFREARRALDLISTTLSQATLNSYQDYYYTGTQSNIPPATGSGAPAAYVRQSELQFRVDAAASTFGTTGSPVEAPGHSVFFQAPLGLTADGSSLGGLLNARGYGIVFSGDDKRRPAFVNGYDIPVKRRYRLVEYRPTAEYQSATAGGNTIYNHPADWFTLAMGNSCRVVADNILLLLLSPRSSSQGAGGAVEPWSIAPHYHYNSLDSDNSTAALDGLLVRTDGTVAQGTQHMLPPLIAVTLVALDETSAQQWSARRGDNGVDVLSEAHAAFTDASRYESDMGALRDYLQKQKLNFRIFNSTVALRNAVSER